MPGHYTPRLQAAMTRLGSRLPFQQAAEEIGHGYQTTVAASTLRAVLYRHGQAAEELSKQEVERIEQEAPTAEAQPENLQVSVDGAFILLTNGDWREIKSMAVGEFKKEWEEKTGKFRVKTSDMSYFARSYRARDFERYALGELHRRGLDNAEQVVAVNDGAEWIQSFLDYHCPDAERIIDFAHAASYVAQAGKSVWEEESDLFKGWFRKSCHRLKHKPPAETIANIRLLRPKTKNDEQAAQLDGALFYLQSRLSMIDYAHFRHRGYPIGSGNVESGHKVVVHSRMKGAGMRWAEHRVDQMLALRSIICNRRWQEGWQDIVHFHQQKQRIRVKQRAHDKRTPPPEPITFASLQKAGLLPAEDDSVADEPASEITKYERPGPDHPWRNDKWPTKESWRWN